MASGRRKKSLQSESNRSLFEFLTRKDSQCDPTKLVSIILSDIINSSIATAEKGISDSDQRHHASADDKTIERWKRNQPWLIVLQTDSGIRLKCSVCAEVKVSSIWAQEGSGNVQNNSVTRHSQANEHCKAEQLTGQ